MMKKAWMCLLVAAAMKKLKEWTIRIKYKHTRCLIRVLLISYKIRSSQILPKLIMETPIIIYKLSIIWRLLITRVDLDLGMEVKITHNK